MQKNFNDPDWKKYLPIPVCEDHPEYNGFYMKAWEMARDHVRYIEGMPQNPYMDEAFCDTQVWIWDTCFMSMFCKFASEVFPGVETFKNFYSVIHGGKLLPQIVPKEDEPVWTKATPGVPFNIQVHIADNPPLFAWGEYENALMSGDKEYLRELLYGENMLARHYEWVENLKEKFKPFGVHAETWLICEKNGYRWEGGRSGMDNTPRGRIGESCEKARPQNPDMLWLDAICQQALSARVLAKMYAILGDRESEKLWMQRFEEKKNTVNGLYWDGEDKFYYDIDVNTNEFYKVKTVASFWPLTAGIATPEQAKIMVGYLKDRNVFGGDVPFISLARNDADFSPEGKYWRGSVWLPTAYAALKGLSDYGMHKEAHEYGVKLINHMLRTYEEFEPHTIWECYAPDFYRPGTTAKGNELSRPDFCGWSALGPISVYIEHVLGFHTVNAFERRVEWERPCELKGEAGVKNLRFGNVVTDISAKGSICRVKTNEPYTLCINGKEYEIKIGENEFSI